MSMTIEATRLQPGDKFPDGGIVRCGIRFAGKVVLAMNNIGYPDRILKDDCKVIIYREKP